MNIHNKTNTSSVLSKFGQIQVLIVWLLLSIGVNASAQTTVNSLSALRPYLDDNNANVKLAPGTYSLSAADVRAENWNNPLFFFEGDNSTFDFTGVTINFDTDIMQAFGSADVYQIQIVGSNIVLKNLTMVDIGSKAPNFRSTNVVMDGSNNRVEGFHMTVRGSYPYGYGDLFGKGSQPVIGHKKHCGLLIRGDDNHVKGVTMIHRAYGHGIFAQGAYDCIVEDCYVEGELRSTDDILQERGTGSPADDVDFMTVNGYTVPSGYMISLQEDGIRSYGNADIYPSGVRDTRNMTVLNCTVKRMRSGVVLTHNSGTRYVEDCSTIECEKGYSIGRGDIVNCSSDAKYGPAYRADYSSDNNINADITILSNDGAYNGSGALAYIAGGSNVNITLRGTESSVNQNLKVIVGGDVSTKGHLGSDNSSQDNLTASSLTVNNFTNYPLMLSNKSSNCDGESCGSITNQGSGNDVNSSSNCDTTPPPPTCTTYNQSITPPAGIVSGINYSYFEGTWDLLPNFNALNPTKSGLTSVINLNEASAADNFGLAFQGYINVPSDGQYTFYTTSDDGSKLYIDGSAVVNNDGLHGAEEESGQICLEAGYHQFRVEFFEKTGGNALSVAYAGPNIVKTNALSLFGTSGASGCSLPWNDSDFTVSNSNIDYSSGTIDISCVSNVEVSMDIEGIGSMEDADFLHVYYAVDGGSQQIISENVNAFSKKTVSVNGVSGNTLEIIVRGATSVAAETYYISNITVSESTNNKQEQTITFPAIGIRTVGDADFTPGASASSGLPISYYSSNTSVATVVNGNIRIVGAGTSTITASQEGNTTFETAPSATQLLTVTAINDGENLALNGAATQSTTSQAHGGEASRAIDGNTNGNWSDGSVTHTESEPDPWWQVDLGNTYNIGEINVFNRTNSCCMARLTNFTVLVINASGDATFSQSFNAYPSPSVTVDAGGASGQIVRIELNDNNVLSLAEVEVYASAGGPVDNTITIQENANGFCAVDGSVDNNHANHTGTGFANTDNAIGNGINYKINGLAGTYSFVWRYAGTSNRPANLIVDGVTVASNITFNTTGTWTSWNATQPTTVNLPTGIKEVRLEASNGSGLANIDYMEITGPNVAASECTTNGGNCSDFFRGITVRHINPGCSNNDGQIIVSFENSDAHSQIQLSLDGGSSYPVTVNDNTGSYSFSGLSNDEYEIAARYAGGDCEFNIAHAILVQDCGDIPLNPGGVSWHDSYEANGFCWCSTNFDHDLDDKVVTINGTRYSVVDICDELEQHPLFRNRNSADNIYNDVQCGNGPINDSDDEPLCPGRVDQGVEGCLVTGVRWDMEWLAGRDRFQGGNLARMDLSEKASQQIYPNPVVGGTEIAILTDMEIAAVNVIDMKGQPHGAPLLAGNKIATTGYPSGLYLLVVTFSDGSTHKAKFLVK